MMLHGQSHRSMCLHMILRPMRVCRINNVLLMLLALILIMATPLTGNPNLQNPYGFGNRCQKHSDCSDISDELECTNQKGCLDSNTWGSCSCKANYSWSEQANKCYPFDDAGNVVRLSINLSIKSFHAWGIN